jgi:hypothetical protein
MAEVWQLFLSPVKTPTETLVAGTIDFYEPGTTGESNRKDVYLDNTATTVAANPYTLDSDATAILYGSGLYHIVIKDSLGNTEYDYDYLNPQGSGNLVSQVREEHTATAAQTVFTLTTSYVVSSGKTNLAVLIDGRKQGLTAYTETDANTVTFSEGLSAGQVVEFVIGLYDVSPNIITTSDVTDSPTAGKIATWDGILASDTTINLEDVSASINTSGKLLGRILMNSTTGRLVYSSGALAADVWKFMDGTTAHSPV